MTTELETIPEWTKYLVIIPAIDRAAPCSTIEKVVECIQREGVAFVCVVHRIEDGALGDIVWPWWVKGGLA